MTLDPPEPPRPVSRRAWLAGAATGSFVALSAPARGRSDADDLAAILAPIRRRYDLPALAAAVIRDGRVTRRAAVGVREHGRPERVTVTDRFHLGSCTKAMTATLLAMLVEEGRLAWETTLAEALPDLRGAIPESRRRATVAMLLCHRGGFPERSAPHGQTLLDLHRLEGPLTEQRRHFVERILREEPAYEPGTRTLYSNAGYVVAGHVAEVVGGAPYETLMRQRLFRPLGMTTAGFGPMGSADRVDQPRQHVRRGDRHEAILPGPRADNPPVLQSAGRVHCSIEDWAKFVALHARVGEGRPALLAPETVRRLHTPPFGDDAAMGWFVVERAWGGGAVLHHAGSNTLNFAVAWVAPRKRFAVVVATNEGGAVAPRACDDVAAALVRRYAG